VTLLIAGAVALLLFRLRLDAKPSVVNTDHDRLQFPQGPRPQIIYRPPPHHLCSLRTKLSKRYGDNVALHSLDLEIQAGENLRPARSQRGRKNDHD